jgi:hypothetical protein
MESYKKDSDRFYQMLEQRERDLAEAETRDDLVRRLEENGVDVAQFMRDLKKVVKSFDALGLSVDFQRELIAKAVLLRVGGSLDDPN